MTRLDNSLKRALADYLIALGDDELILGHRDSEWCGHAPILEEDIAFANLALDEVGHARVWYQLAAALLDEDVAKYPDKLTFLRPASEYRCVQLVETPNGDWAFTMLRQYFFDAFEVLRLEKLRSSAHSPLAEASAKILNEELYHLRHTSAWLPRLGLGTDESHSRMQAALDKLWPYALQLLDPLPEEAALAAHDLVPDSAGLQSEWLADVSVMLQQSGLAAPEDSRAVSSSRTEHSPYLESMLEEMQSVARLAPAARW